MFVSVTRLRLRSVRFLPGFFWHTMRSTRQVQRAPGYLGGLVAPEGATAYWTITGWTDSASMLLYRNTAAHKVAMPKLLRWCDEASVAHWEQDSTRLPSLPEALDRMVREGRISKVRHPSPAHAAGEIAPDRKVPVGGMPLPPIPASDAS